MFARYVFRAPTDWGYDASYMLYGTLFMMAGAYALSRGAHVRGDFLYRGFSPRTQAAFDLALYLLFFVPGMAALIYSGWGFFDLSYTMDERSSFSPKGPVVWPFKALIPIVGALMLLQGLAEIVRRAIILGWPLEWTEIIVIFVPIFLPLLKLFDIDPLFFGIIVALNLQTSFLSPPVAMAPFYLKGVAPKHVGLDQIFRGVMPFMLIVLLSMAILYVWPQLALWLPTVVYR